MSKENEGSTYAKFADALLMESLQKYRMPKEEKDVPVEEYYRMNLEAIAIEQENFD
jgi:hypothetical protein